MRQHTTARITRHTTARITRRHFGRISTAGAIATAIPTAARGAEVKRKGWIDAHVHVWTPDIKKYPLADGYDAEICRPAPLLKLAPARRKAQVERLARAAMRRRQVEIDSACAQWGNSELA